MMTTNDTTGALYDPAMQIYDPERAREYFEFLVAKHRSFDSTLSDASAREMVRLNLAYYSYLFGPSTVVQVNQAFGLPVLSHKELTKKCLAYRNPNQPLKLCSTQVAASKLGIDESDVLRLVESGAVPRHTKEGFEGIVLVDASQVRSAIYTPA